jgi:hypothetical protein
MDVMALGQVFSNYFGFSCQFSVYQLLHFSHIIRGWYSEPFMAKRLSFHPILKVKQMEGRSIAQAVSRWLPTAAARI